MPTKNDSGSLGIHSTNVPSARLHLIAGRNEIRTVFFVCEQAPLMTLQSHGLPIRCPICSMSSGRMFR
jgi:hypothetical protein